MKRTLLTGLVGMAFAVPAFGKDGPPPEAPPPAAKAPVASAAPTYVIDAECIGDSRECCTFVSRGETAVHISCGEKAQDVADAIRAWRAAVVAAQARRRTAPAAGPGATPAPLTPAPQAGGVP